MRAKLIITIALAVLAGLTLFAGLALAKSRDFDVRNDWGRAFGRLNWNNGDIKVVGTLEQEAPRKNSFLYLSWDALGTHYNKEVAGVGSGKHSRDHVNFRRHFDFMGGPSEIKLTVCSQVNGDWRCGVPQGF